MTDLITERKTTHGPYGLTATVAQEIKDIYRTYGYSSLTSCQRESLDLIATKIARILVGDSKTRDHWDDIAGYAKIAND
jgi:hypothetical protein